MEIVAPSNAALSAVQAQAKATPRTTSKIAPLCDTYAGTLKAFLDALAGGLWPADVKGAVDDVMASVGAQLNTARQCAKAKTIADVNAAWDYVDPHPGSAQVLRARLGLPLAG